jgi:hypothetical protein
MFVPTFFTDTLAWAITAPGHRFNAADKTAGLNLSESRDTKQYENANINVEIRQSVESHFHDSPETWQAFSSNRWKRLLVPLRRGCQCFFLY